MKTRVTSLDWHDRTRWNIQWTMFFSFISVLHICFNIKRTLFIPKLTYRFVVRWSVVHCQAFVLTVRLFVSAKVSLNTTTPLLSFEFVARFLTLHTITLDTVVGIGMQNSGNGSWIHLIYVLNLNELNKTFSLYIWWSFWLLLLLLNVGLNLNRELKRTLKRD